MDKLNTSKTEQIRLIVCEGRRFSESVSIESERQIVDTRETVVWSREWQKSLPKVGPLINAGPGDGLGGRV
jgi:hypothetical protein